MVTPSVDGECAAVMDINAVLRMVELAPSAQGAGWPPDTGPSHPNCARLRPRRSNSWRDDPESGSLWQELRVLNTAQRANEPDGQHRELAPAPVQGATVPVTNTPRPRWDATRHRIPRLQVPVPCLTRV